MRFEELDETVTFDIGPLPLPVTLHRGPLGPPWELPWTTLFFTEQGIYTLHNLTVLLLDLEKNFEICMLLAFGGPPPGPPWGPHTCTIWTNLNSRPVRMIPVKFGSNPTMRFQEEEEGPPPQGPIGATLGTAMNKFYSSPNKVSTHYITWLFSFWIWRRRCLKFAWFWPLGASPWIPYP